MQELPNYREAVTAEYDPASGRVVVGFDNDTSFSFPARSLQGLDTATDQQLAEVKIVGEEGLNWESLDADFTIGGLMRGSFGTARFMRGRTGTK